MSNEQLTDAQLSEAVCKAVGIEPRQEWVVGRQEERTVRMSQPGWTEKGALAWLDMMRRQGLHMDQDVYPLAVYPNVLDWAGFGRVVERMRDLVVNFTISDTPTRYMVELYPFGGEIVYGTGDTLPRALALAVRAWKEGR